MAIHALELAEPYTTNDPGWRFRFRTVLVLVARQNGKSDLSRIVALFKLYVLGVRLVCGTAQDLDIARTMLHLTNDLVDGVPALQAEKVTLVRANGKERLILTDGREYVIKATNRKAGRGITVDHLTLDELREQTDWLAWGALTKTTNARPNGQIWAMSNAGDESSVVLNQLQANAHNGRAGQLFIAEYSGPDGCELDDVDALAQANPALGHLIDIETLLSDVSTDPPDIVRTEILCQRVEQLDGAIDLAAWKAAADSTGTLDAVRDRVVVCVDAAPDGQHVTLCGAAQTDDGRVRVEVIAAWPGTEQARRDLPDLLDRISPAAVAWFPGGPADALADLLKGGAFAERIGDPVKITGADASAACASFADLVRTGGLVHSADELLTAHVAGAKKWRQGDGWRYVRRGVGHVDAVYAASGAAYVAQTLPAEKPRRRAFAV